jgi:hypothetical protein
VAFGTKQHGGLIVHRQKPLRLTGRLEAAHDFLSSPRMSVRSLSAIVQPFVLAMFDPRSQVGLRGTV